MRTRIGRPSPAMVVAIVALVAALSGTTWAAVNTAPVGTGGGASAGSASAGANASATRAQRRAARRRAARRRNAKVIPSRNSVGVRQLKRNSVVTGKVRNNAINGAKVRNKSLTGADINLNLLGKVPSASSADSASGASQVDGHDAECPDGTDLINGVCFEKSANGAAPDVMTAAEDCYNKGGWLPTTLQLRSVRSFINLGTGVGDDKRYTDTIHADTTGGGYSTILVDGAGNLWEQAIDEPSRYICVYPLVR